MNGRRVELIHDYYHGTLAPAAQRELARMLETDAEARREFTRQALWASGLGRALAQVRVRAQASARWRRRSSASRWRLPLAAAALLLLATGVGLASWLAGGQRGGERIVAHFIAGAPPSGTGGQFGPIRLLADDGSERRLLGGETIPAGSRLILGDDACAQVRLTDGSELDLDRDTAVSFGGPGEALSLLHGSIFCSVAKRPAGATPFTIGLPEGRTATALGTRFELTAAAATTRLRVEEGRVRLATPAGTAGTAGPLQLLQVAATGGATGPTGIALHEIAAWKYRTAEVPAGTTVFADGFDSDAGGWETVQSPGGPLRYVQHQGRSCLALPLKARTSAVIYPRFPVRFRNFAFSFRIYLDRSIQASVLPAFNVAGAAKATVTSESDQPPTVHHPLTGNWLDIRVVVRGDRVQNQVMQDGRLMQEGNGRIPMDQGHFTRVGLVANCLHNDCVLMIDHFTIINLGD